jgi:hypothetical protein
MLFGKPKPTVTPEDRDWIEEAFLGLNKNIRAIISRMLLDSCDIVGQC